MTRSRPVFTLLLCALLAACGESAPPRDVESLAAASSSALGPVSQRAIAQDDLPPAGTRSLFDHLLAQNDGLPWPFEKLVTLVQQQAPAGAQPQAVLIPLGRSLLKASADFAQPRVVLAADYHAANTPAALGIAPRGQLFLGFTEAASEIEVISYNERAGRFEFQLVQNYCEGCVPRIVYARRAICQTCHQGGSPIFSVRPWQETNGAPEIAARISARLREALGEDAYLGVPLAQPLSTPERVDELTDVGNFINVTQRIWLDGCGADGAACRRALLREALRFSDDPAAFDESAPAAQALRALQAKHWPKDGIAVPDNDLTNRDPLSESISLRERVAQWFRPAQPRARNNEDLEAFARLPALPLAQDPLTPRPPKRVLHAQDLDGVPALAQFFTEADRRSLLAAHGNDWPRVLAAVNALPEAQFAPEPFSRVRVMQALLARQGTAPAYCCLETADMSPPQTSGVPPLALAADSPLRAFETYCFACHRGNPAQRLNFMAGASEAQVRKSIEATSAIRDALDWERFQGTDKAAKLMPPVDSAQHAALVAALQQNPQLLEQMRSVVPGLFDF